mgnify:CR=1 FL=1
MIGAAPEVNELCRDYYYILIWGAPLVLGNYVALGWLMGQTRVRASVFMQVSMNVLNMVLSIWFVFWLHMDITGVAVATLLSQLYGGILSVVLMYYYGDFDYKALPSGRAAGLARVYRYAAGECKPDDSHCLPADCK